MQVTVKDVSELGREMTITIEDANIEQQIATRLKALAPTIKMAGFRKGKVPMKLVEQQYSGSARSEVVDSLVQESMREAFEQEKLEPAGPPHISDMKEDGNNIVYTLTFEVFPELKPVKLDEIKIEKLATEINDDDITVMLDQLRGQRGQWEDVSRKAKEGDGVTIDFVGKIDGEAFDGGAGQNVFVEIGNGSMLPEFESQLVGHKADSKVVAKMTFPDDYRAEHLAGKQAEFDITVISVKGKVLPPLDDAFAKLCGVDSLVQLKKDVLDNMTRESATAIKIQNKRKVMDAIYAANTLTLPTVPVEREAQFLLEQAQNNLRGQGVNVADLNLLPEAFKEPAERRVTLSLLVGKLISDHKITPDKGRVEAAIKDIAANYEDPSEVIEHYTNTPEKLSEVELSVLEDTVVEKVLGLVKITEKKVSFEEVMQAGNTAV